MVTDIVWSAREVLDLAVTIRVGSEPEAVEPPAARDGLTRCRPAQLRTEQQLIARKAPK